MFIKKSTTIIITILITISLLTAPATYALRPSDIGGLIDISADSLMNTATCYAAGRIAQWLGDLAGDLFEDRILGGIIGNEVPVKDSQARKNLKRQTEKERIKDLMARCVARNVLTGTLNGIIDLSRYGGRDGGATYVRNWRNFQTNSHYRGEALFRSILANTPVCDHLRDFIYGSYRVTNQSRTSLSGINLRYGNLDPFTLRARCTMPSGFDIAAYRQDFAGNGGWATFDRLLEPQNNPIGLALMAADEMNTQRSLEERADSADAQAGGGHTSPRESDSVSSCRVVDPVTNKCIIYNMIRAPGSYVRDSLAAVAQSELDWISGIDELEELVQVLLNSILTKMLDFGAERPPGVSVNDPIIPTVAPTPTITPPPTGTPGPTGTPPPGGQCVRRPGGGQYESNVNGLINNFRSSNPDLFEGQYLIRPPYPTNEETYMNFVISGLQGQGFTVQRVNEDIILIKQSNDLSEEYDILTSSHMIRRACGNCGRGAYQSTCVPAEF
jgi:hypothetical protein